MTSSGDDEPESAASAGSDEGEEIVELVVSSDLMAEVIEQSLEITEHIGPLPPPHTLSEYDRTVPGLAQQIVAWTDSEIRHRQRMESDAVQASIKLGLRGQAVGALIVVLAVILILAGRTTEGLIALTPIVLAFLGGTALPEIRDRFGRDDDDPDDDDET